MVSLEKKIVALILGAMRARREQAPSAASEPRGASRATAKVRPATFSDFDAVAALKCRWGLAEDSYQNWERLWWNNPAFADFPAERPIGWVLEAEGNVVGYLGNIFQIYRFGDKTLKSATAHGLVVEPPYRSLGVSLVAAYFRQKDIDLYISTGEIAPVGKIGRIFKSEPLPHEDYEAVLFWVLQPRSFVQAVLKKLGMGATVSTFAGVFGSLAMRIDQLARSRHPKNVSAGLTIREMNIHDIGNDFQDLWMEKLKGEPRLFADRTPSILRWHFDIPGDRGSSCVLACTKDGKLAGYAVIRNEAPDETNLRKSTIADMLVAGDDSAVIESLLAAAHRHARQAGSHILEVAGFPPTIRQILSRSQPYVRKYPTPLFAYKAVDPILHKTIGHGETWYASPFDGDFTLIRPSFSSSVNRPASMMTRGSASAVTGSGPERERTASLSVTT